MTRQIPHHRILKKREVAVVACPFSYALDIQCICFEAYYSQCIRISGGQPRKGVDTGPLQLVQAGLLEDIQKLGWSVDFRGHDRFSIQESLENDPPIGKLLKPRLVSKVNKEVCEAISAHLRDGQLALTLGGDHSLALATVSATLSQYPDACIIWVDAHADINTPETTDSGNLHGCPVSFLMGLKSTNIPEFSWVKPALKPNRIAYIGLRDIDAGERKLLRENNIAAFSMYHVDKYGIGKVMEMALDAINRDRSLPIHLSFDVDALDPTVAPSTGTAVRGGLSWREGHYICEAVAETQLLVALDIMEVNPSLADAAAVKQTVEVGLSLTRCALGETLL